MAASHLCEWSDLIINQWSYDKHHSVACLSEQQNESAMCAVYRRKDSVSHNIDSGRTDETMEIISEVF